MIKYSYHLFERGDRMSKQDLELEAIISEINEIVNEIKEEQKNEQKMIEEKHKVNMQKFAKLIEFTKIQDMTNQVFERRIATIEAILYEALNMKY